MAFPSALTRTKNWGTEVLTDSDLEGQLDLIIDWTNALANGTTGHAHTGSSSQGPKLSLTASAAITGVLPVVNGGTGQATLTAFLNLVYPIGVIYTSIVSTNPATVLGFGTWTAFGAGKVLVGLDSGDTDFDTVEETGGAKTVTLDTTMIPAHTHTINMSTNSDGGTTGYAVNASAIAGATTPSTSSTGGGAAHANVQPYIVVYRFKRTA